MAVEAWEAAGGRDDDAELTFYPEELAALTVGLQAYISRSLTELQ